MTMCPYYLNLFNSNVIDYSYQVAIKSSGILVVWCESSGVLLWLPPVYEIESLKNLSLSSLSIPHDPMPETCVICEALCFERVYRWLLDLTNLDNAGYNTILRRSSWELIY